MPILNITGLPVDDTDADAADVTDPIEQIVALLNGGLDSDNIASLNGTKIIAGTLPASAMSSTAREGWQTGILPAPNTVTYNGQRSYDLVFNSTNLTSYLSEGMRIRTNRTVSAPTQCTNLNGSSQYWTKSSPNKSTFTDDFVVTAFVKVSAYPSAAGVIMSRYNGTSGWSFEINNVGQLILIGFNGGSGNSSYITSYQSVPLNRWVRVTAQLDMSAFTATTTTSYIMFNDVDVPATVARGGTNPTALVQAGNLEVGSRNGGTSFFSGKIAQAAFFTAKVTQATMKTYTSQGLTGTETNLGSAYSFNGVATDLNTTSPNDLSVGGGSVVATEADSPFGNGGVSATKDYGIITAKVFSTNTTLTVQAPEGCTIPTSGGVSSVDYANDKIPYNFPMSPEKWTLHVLLMTAVGTLTPTQNTWYNSSGIKLSVPVGGWRLEYIAATYTNDTSATSVVAQTNLSTSASAEDDVAMRTHSQMNVGSGNLVLLVPQSKNKHVTLSALTDYYLIHRTTVSGVENLAVAADVFPTTITALCAYL